MPNPDNLWDLHKSIYRTLKKRAKALEGHISRELKAYDSNQRKFAKRDFVSSTPEKLFERIAESHVVYLGDFHSFDQNSRNLERLTRELIKQKNKFSLGVELVHQKHQVAIQQYIAHQITELELLEEIEYHESWRFPWTYYRPFFEMARKHNLSVIALNSDGSLSERDESAANILKKFIEDNPNQRLLVLFGELHIVPNKLPQMVMEKVKATLPDYSDTIIHQNLDEVYWKIHELEIEKNNYIIQFNDREFSLQTSPPWIKYESMIYWYENLSDDPEFELHDYLIEDGVLGLHSNVPENFVFLCDKIKNTLGVDANSDEIEDFNLYEHQNLSLILDKIGRVPKSTITNFLQRLVKESRVFRIPFSNNYYCSAYSINRMSFLCGLHLQDIAIRKQNINYESILMESSLEKKLCLFIKQYIAGYLASKVINPYRKCDRYLDFKEKVTFNNLSKDSYNLLTSVIAFIEDDGTTEIPRLLQQKSLFHLHELSRRLGFYLGDVLYEDFLVRAHSKNSELLPYLFNSDFNYSTLRKFMDELIPKNKYLFHKKRQF